MCYNNVMQTRINNQLRMVMVAWTKYQSNPTTVNRTVFINLLGSTLRSIETLMKNEPNAINMNAARADYFAIIGALHPNFNTHPTRLKSVGAQVARWARNFETV